MWICCIWGEVKDRCNAICTAAFQPLGNPALVIHMVERQVSQYTYTFPLVVAVSDLSITGSF